MCTSYGLYLTELYSTVQNLKISFITDEIYTYKHKHTNMLV